MSDRWDAVRAALRARFPDAAPVAELASFLAAEGLDEAQIGEVLAGFATDPGGDLAGLDRRAAPSTTGGRGAAPLKRAPVAPIRVPGPHEWGRFTPEAWGRVLQLNAGGILAASDLERVLDHALDHGGGRVDLSVLRAVLDGVGLADAGAHSDPTTIH